jgi:hypothetical protein
MCRRAQTRRRRGLIGAPRYFSLGAPGSARPEFFTGAQPFSRIRVTDSRPFGAIAADQKEFT